MANVYSNTISLPPHEGWIPVPPPTREARRARLYMFAFNPVLIRKDNLYCNSLPVSLPFLLVLFVLSRIHTRPLTVSFHLYAAYLPIRSFAFVCNFWFCQVTPL